MRVTSRRGSCIGFAALLLSGSCSSSSDDRGAPGSMDGGAPGDGGHGGGPDVDGGGHAPDASDADDANPSGDDASVRSDDAATTQADASHADGTAPDSGATRTYSTTFDGTEAPISENGAWTHVGLDWALVDTGGGLAYGTQTGTGGYNDSYAHLSGFPANQRASGVIHKDPGIDGSTTHELEILMRWSDSAHDAHGYECNLAWDGSYAQIVRWNGMLGDFTYLGSGSVPGGVHDGDTLSASAVGSLITLYVNGVSIATATDSTWKTGNPGMGLWRGGPSGAFVGDYAFTSYTASSIP